ncbi:LacI family DNA-binding transcriptional regulator [Egicoccus sp. AB-alg6-2]|uniref:LacI family DNA-binding transcriptional regulator n=1 Tax=Egicoccus sp. AB-alg6-2 TaxID=3242692 RepID=UPI00359EA7C8
MAKTTMSDVARFAGVDVSTVSRALNERTAAMLRSETVERVLAAASELGYQPNVLARGLRTQRSHTVGMLLPDLTNPFFPPIVRGLEDALDAGGYTLIVTNTDNDARREARSLQSLVGRQVDGLVVATSHLDSDEGTAAVGNLPVVLVNRRGTDPSVPAVVPDDAAGVTLAVRHLLDLGHRRIAHVAGPTDTSTGRSRAEAFETFATDAGVYDPALVEHAAIFAVGDGMEACQRLLEQHPDVTAICAANDLLAIGCLRALRAAGRRVPQEVSLVGFNDMPLVDLIDPPLTTVRIPQYEMGRRAGELLLGLLDDPPARRARKAVELAPELVVRQSTAAPGAS